MKKKKYLYLLLLLILPIIFFSVSKINLKNSINKNTNKTENSEEIALGSTSTITFTDTTLKVCANPWSSNHDNKIRQVTKVTITCRNSRTNFNSGELTVISKKAPFWDNQCGTLNVSSWAGGGYNCTIKMINTTYKNYEVDKDTKTANKINKYILDGNGGKVSYISSGNASSLTLNGVYGYQAELGKYSAKRDGYSFEGWGESASCTSGSKTTTTFNTNNKKYYACWKKTSSSNPGGGTCKGGETYNYTIKVGETKELRQEIMRKCNFKINDPSSTSGATEIKSGDEFITIKDSNKKDRTKITEVTGKKAGKAVVEFYYPLVGLGIKKIIANITVTGNSSNNGYTVNKTAWITQDTSVKNSSGNNETIKKCSQIYVTTCNGNSQGAICSFTYNGKTYSSLNSKYYNTTKPSDCNASGGYQVNKTAWITQDTSVKNSSGSNETIKKCSQIYVTTCNGNSQGAICSFTYNGKTYSSLNSKYYNTTKPSACNGGGGGGNTPPPITPVPTPSPTTEPINGIRYAKNNASAGGKQVNCGDEVYVTTCETLTSSTNPTCIVTKINGVSVNTTTRVYRNQLVMSRSALPENCSSETKQYTIKETSFYTSTSKIGSKTDNSIPCAEEVTINGSLSEACTYSNNKYCKVTYNGSEGYVYRYDLSSSQVDPATCPEEVEASCYYDETNDKYIWSEEDLSDKYTIDASATTEDDCNALNGDGEKNCKTSNKQTEVKETKKQVKVCYEKKNNKITETTDIMDMFSCAKDYTQNPVEQTENTCDKVKNGTCHKTYLVSCSNGTRPALEITASLLNQGLGTITIKGRKISNEVTSYYLDDSSNPTVDSLWKDFADSNKVAYEQKEAGLYYAWVKDEKGILSRPMFAVVHDADITNTLQTLSVKDANDVAVTLNSIEGENAYLDVMPSDYSLLSNRLKNDKTLAGFDSLSMGYKIEVNSDKISVFATLTSSDASYVEGYEPRTVNLDYGENKILIKIKNKEGKVRTYTIIATRTDNRVSNNLLTDLTVSKGKIEFDPYVTDYDIEVPKNTKKVSINGTLASDTSSFVEGNEPREIELTEDITTAVLEVISESGITRSYVLTFIKKGAEEETSTSAYLDTLTIEGTAIDFNKEIYEYSVTVPYEYSSVNVYAFPESDNAFAEVEGDRGLKVGANNLKITVKNGKLTKTYTITVIRKEAGLEISNDVTLSSLTVKGYGIDFSPEKLDYTIKIKREKSLIITATPTSNRSEVYMYGNNSLTGFSTVRIKVVAENGATNIYSIDIQKDSYNKVLEITSVIIGSVIILGTGIIIVVRKKNKKMKEYLGK